MNISRKPAALTIRRYANKNFIISAFLEGFV
jgi:hypothetical protein